MNRRNLNPKSLTLNPESGQAMMSTVILLFVVSIVSVFASVSPALSDLSNARSLLNSKKAFIAAEAGMEDLGYRIAAALQYDDEEVLLVGEQYATSTVTTDISTGIRSVLAVGEKDERFRSSNLYMQKGTPVSFQYAIQAGQGGFSMINSAQIIGNLYADGPVTGANSSSVSGDVVSAGDTGLIEGMTVGGSAYANTIDDSIVEGDAYYQSIQNTNVNGTLYPGSADLPSRPFPISEETLDEWEALAEEGGIISSPCPYVINNSRTLGPVKITCDVELKSGADLTLAGPVWVEGDVLFRNTTHTRIDSNLPGMSLAIIADNPSNRLGEGVIEVRNSAHFYGTGSGSYVFLVSRNTSASQGGSTDAIEFVNSSSGDLVLYSNNGSIDFGNSGDIISATGYRIDMSNSAVLEYDEGLESAIFETGPGGSWSIIGWEEQE